MLSEMVCPREAGYGAEPWGSGWALDRGLFRATAGAEAV